MNNRVSAPVQVNRNGNFAIEGDSGITKATIDYISFDFKYELWGDVDTQRRRVELLF